MTCIIRVRLSLQVNSPTLIIIMLIRGLRCPPTTTNAQPGTTLSSPDIIKSVSRTITPPVSPHHVRLGAISAAKTEPSRLSVISDPIEHWPGRPRRNALDFCHRRFVGQHRQSFVEYGKQIESKPGRRESKFGRLYRKASDISGRRSQFQQPQDIRSDMNGGRKFRQMAAESSYEWRPKVPMNGHRK